MSSVVNNQIVGNRNQANRTSGSMRPPEILNVKLNPLVDKVKVDTSILDPVVSSSNHCRFIIPNNGILNKHSIIEVGFKTANTDGRSSVFLPINIGAYACIKRAVFKIGSTVVSEIDDFNIWMSGRTNYLRPEDNNTLHGILSGRTLEYKLDNLGELQFKTNKGEFVNADGSINTFTQDEINLIGNKQNFQLSLKELFPFLGTMDLPLYAIKQQLSLELFFDPDFFCIDSTATAFGALTCVVDETKTKLVADYYYYSEDIMKQEQVKYNNMTMDLLEYVIVRTSLSVADSKNFSRNLGGAGKIVNKVFVSNLTDVFDGSPKCIFGKFQSLAPSTTLVDGVVPPISVNLQYNDENLFPISCSNYMNLQSYTDLAMGIKNYIPIEQLTTKVASGASLFNNKAITSVDGRRGFYILPINKNKRINSKGIQLQQGIVFTEATTNTVWIEIQKTLKFNNGFVEVNYV